ncbi:hypothetical protein PM082_006316 [Marasmius tenuissimus]|nr:hypothetical protein PM082_006316 [Marasmius tenuissimus]
MIWDIGDYYTTYPFSIHSAASPFQPGYSLGTVVSYLPEIAEVQVLSDQCTKLALDTRYMCPPCSHLDRKVEKVKERAGYMSGGNLKNPECSHAQLVSRIETRNDKITKQTTSILNVKRTLKRARARVNDLEDLKSFIANNSVPGVTRLLAQCASEGVGVRAAIERMSMATRGEYHSHKYTEDEIDLATLGYLTGGGSLLYALHHSNSSLPSLTTVNAHRIDFDLITSVGLEDLADDILHNIAKLFDPDSMNNALKASQSGHTLSLDEIAIDEHPFYQKQHDKIGGLCREHTDHLNLTIGFTLDNVFAAAEAVFCETPTAHLAKEATVAAISALSRTRYYAKPILISPTCKVVRVEDSVHMIKVTLQAWKDSPHGEVIHGPIWIIAVDGDSKRRGALYNICMTHRLSDGDPLHKILRPLTGLNKFTSQDGIVMDFDFKHLFKRESRLKWREHRHQLTVTKGICRLLCSKEGMLINSTVVNKMLISSWLSRLPDLARSTIQALLNPSDSQDVPRAIDLMKLVDELRNVSRYNPSEDATGIAISLLGDIIHELIQSFIDPALSLTEQVQHLLTSAHILFAVFEEHGTAFMPNQLYGDIQAMVKAAVFMVARQQDLDPSQEVFFTLLGDDVLETLFGLVQMLGGHSPNCDGKELANRMSRAMNIKNIYERHPDWEKQPKRLAMNRSRDADHLRPRNWKGDVQASSCNLGDCYCQAQKRAENMLSSYGITMKFGELFQREDVDLMRPPRAQGRYPGLSKEFDRSMDDLPTADSAAEGSSNNLGGNPFESEGASTIPAPELPPNPSESIAPNPPSATGTCAVDGPLYQSPADKENIESPTTTNSTSRSSTPPLIYHEIRACDLASLEVVHNMLEEEEASQLETDGYSVWMVIDGKPCHKWSIIRIVFAMKGAFDRMKSKDRILRVRCYSIGGEKWEMSMEEPSIPEKDRFNLGDLFVTLLHLPDVGVCLAVVQSTSMRNREVSVPCLNSKELILPDANCTLCGQVLSLIPVKGIDLRGDTAPETMWLWDGEYVAFNSTAKNTANQNLNQKALVVSAPGFLAIPVGSNAGKPISDHLPEASTRRKQNLDDTWSVGHTFLEDSMNRLWGDVLRLKHWSKIPTVGGVRKGLFPCQMDDQLHFFQSTKDINMKDDGTRCSICETFIEPKNRQKHAAKHVLFSKRGVEDPTAKHKVSVNPCGFCAGPSSTEKCRVELRKKKTVSSCPQAYNFQYHAASTFKPSSPCTNVPIACPLCKSSAQNHWKYNILDHLEQCHPSWRVQTTDEFREGIRITREEELAMNIPADLIPEDYLAPSVCVSATSVIQQPALKRPPTSLPGSPTTVRTRKRGKKQCPDSLEESSDQGGINDGLMLTNRLHS